MEFYSKPCLNVLFVLSSHKKITKVQPCGTEHTYHLKVVGSNPSWGTKFFFNYFFIALFFINIYYYYCYYYYYFIIKFKKPKLQLYGTKHTYHLKVVGLNPSWGTKKNFF